MNTKRVTVTERTFDDAGNVVKEVVTVTEYDNSYQSVIPWTAPQPQYPYVTY